MGVVWLGGDRCSLVLSSLLASRVGARIVYLSVALVLYCFNTDRCAMYCVLYGFFKWNPEPHGCLLIPHTSVRATPTAAPLGRPLLGPAPV